MNKKKKVYSSRTNYVIIIKNISKNIMLQSNKSMENRNNNAKYSDKKGKKHITLIFAWYESLNFLFAWYFVPEKKAYLEKCQKTTTITTCIKSLRISNALQILYQKDMKVTSEL